ncbi:hypothetical protein U9M48_002084, partial [Paspalum notatum var. saurae]
MAGCCGGRTTPPSLDECRDLNADADADADAVNCEPELRPLLRRTARPRTTPSTHGPELSEDPDEYNYYDYTGALERPALPEHVNELPSQELPLIEEPDDQEQASQQQEESHPPTSDLTVETVDPAEEGGGSGFYPLVERKVAAR